MFRWLRWYLAKRRLAFSFARHRSAEVTSWLRKHSAGPEDFPPNTESYERLAAVWDDYGAGLVPGYGEFIAAAEVFYRQPMNAIVDLACGTGLLTRQFAADADRVVGIDISEAMLRRARAFTAASHVRYLRADFRRFELGESFDAAVCGSNSLNYMDTPGELTQVFRCVQRVLRPGGLFVFDVLDRQAFRAQAPWKTVADVRGERFAVYYFYDGVTRVSESRAVFNGAIERHRRIPLEKGDIHQAAVQAGLDVAEHFCASRWLMPLSRWQFYVLRRPGSPDQVSPTQA